MILKYFAQSFGRAVIMLEAFDDFGPAISPVNFLESPELQFLASTLSNVRSVPSFDDAIGHCEQVRIVVDFGVGFVVQAERVLEFEAVVETL